MWHRRVPGSCSWTETLAVTELYTEMTENHVKSKLNIPQLKFPLSGSKKKKMPVTTPTSSDMEEVVIERYITLTE